MFIRFDADDPPLPERGYMRLRKRTLSTDTAASAASASAAAAMCASQLSLTETGILGKQAVVMSNQQEEEDNEKRKGNQEEAPKVAGESVNHGAVEYDDGFVIIERIAEKYCCQLFRLSTYTKYLGAGNSCPGLVLFVFLNLVTHALFVFVEVWVGHWANEEEEKLVRVSTAKRTKKNSEKGKIDLLLFSALLAGVAQASRQRH